MEERRLPHTTDAANNAAGHRHWLLAVFGEALDNGLGGMGAWNARRVRIDGKLIPQPMKLLDSMLAKSVLSSFYRIHMLRQEGLAPLVQSLV